MQISRSAFDRAFAFNILTAADISAGIRPIEVGGQFYKDVTVPVNRALDSIVAEASNRSTSNSSPLGLASNLMWFYRQMNHFAPWDIKYENPWNNTISGGTNTYPGLNAEVYYLGMVMPIDDLGNFTYGYIGNALGLPYDLLIAGSMYAAGFPEPGTNDYNNEILDHAFINLGFQFYRLGVRQRWGSMR
jgi:hypothetical protein